MTDSDWDRQRRSERIKGKKGYKEKHAIKQGLRHIPLLCATLCFTYRKK